MANFAASVFARLGHSPGNPQLPLLPGPGDPKVGKTSVFAKIGGVNYRLPELFLEELGASPTRGLRFSDTFFDGLWVAPTVIDFGNITAAKQRTFTIHSTFATPCTVTAIDLSGVSGVTLLTPGLPITIQPFTTQDFVVEVALAGDTTFDAAALITSDCGNVLVRMTGRRVIIFDTVPQRPIVEQITFGTNIMVSADGSEQAMSWRPTPRSMVQLDIRQTNNQVRTNLLNQVFSASYLLHGLPLWYQGRAVTAAAAAIDVTVQVPTVAMELLPGDTASIVLPDNSTTEAEVLSLTTTSITFTAAVGVALPLRTFIMPVRFGFQESSANLATYAQGAEDLRVKFTLIEYDNIGAVDAGYFDAHPVDGLPIPKAPLYFDGQSRGGTIQSETTRLDSRTGAIVQARSEVIGRPGMPMLVHLQTYEAIDAWRKFLHSLRGSWGLFYVPTGTNDLPLTGAGFTLGGNSFLIPNMGVASMGNHAPRRDVRLTVNGLVYDRRITSVVDNGATETVTLSAVVPGTGVVQPGNAKIEWLSLSRIVGDSVTMKHTLLGVAELRFSIRGVIVV